LLYRLRRGFLLAFEDKEHIQTDDFGFSSQAEMGLVGPTVSTGAFPMPPEGVVHSTSMLANLFEDSDWAGRLPRVGYGNDALTVTKDLLKFSVVNCERSDLFVLASREADLDTL
jgi:hypothetical protein